MATPIINPIIPINSQNLNNSDASLISQVEQENFFNTETDIVNTFVYDSNNNFIRSININYTVLNTKTNNTDVKEIQLDPANDLQSNLLTTGIYNVNYNFLRPTLNSNLSFYLQEISQDRTELRINSNTTNDSQKLELYNTLNDLINNSELFKGIYLNFDDDNLLLIVNVGFDNNTILLKLYQPLPLNYSLKQTLSIFEKVSEPLAYQVEWLEEEIQFDNRIFLKGPNFNLNSKNQNNNSSEYKSINTIYTSSLKSLTSQLGSILNEQRAELNTDYSDYNNFVFFSSAQQRLSNFYYKASLIENYNNQLSVLNTLTTTPEVSSSISFYENQINDLITNFDGYDYFLYFNSGSSSWPKSNSTPPYTLFSTGSSQVIAWFSQQSESASLFDEENENYIYNIFPTYITEDTENNQFRLFTEMSAQMFDDIWLYTQAIKNRQDGDNSLEGGISKDLVADALRSYGLTLYQSSFTDSDLFTSLLGIDQEGNTLPPTGSELITNYVTSSAETTPFDDAQKLIYKRLYHNLPFLLKKKGTVAGLRILLSCFGIPDTLIRISEFGGKDKNPNTWDLWENKFNYAYQSTGSYFISSSFVLNSNWGASNNVPGAIEFKFKAESTPPTNYSQSLWYTDKGLGLFIEYTGSGLVTGSYSASIVDPYYQYGTLKFISGTDSASVYLPFFDNGWWSVLVSSGSNGYELVAKNSIYSGDDGNTLGFQASSSLNVSTLWSASTEIYFASSSNTHEEFSGSLQEIRYYTQPITEDSFDAYVMNPSSIEESQYLAFRASLGGELYTGSISIHPKVTGSWITTSSFNGTSNFYTSLTPIYLPNEEYIFYDQVPVGVKNRISNKIKQNQLILPSTGSGLPTTNVLSPYISIQQNLPVSQSYTSDLNLLEIAFSPQNEINDDINNSLGYFNIGDYLDIRTTGSSYPALDKLRDDYFKKYKASYDYKDYTRLIKYFDNALFKMIKDYVPARTSVSTGIVIKQHILERNKYSEPTVTFTQPEYTSSINMYTITGSDGGVFELQNVTQSWSGSYVTPFGLTPYIQSTEDEFFNGEFSGSNILVTDGKLSDCDLILNTIFNTSSISINNDGGFAGVELFYFIPSQYLNFDKTYYFSFTITAGGSNSYAQPVRLKNTTSTNIIYNSGNISAGGSVSVNNLELKNLLNPVYFEVQEDPGIGLNTFIIDLTISEYQFNDMDGDCDPILNNTSTYPLSQYYMKVDYNSGQLVPTNFNSLITGSGTKAAVKDYYYNLRRQTLPRYEGSKLTGYQINAYTASTDTSYGKSPVIERYSNSFIYFDWIGGANPQYPGGGNVHGIYLIDTEGVAVPLTTDNLNLGRIENIFKQGTTANILPAVYSAGSTPFKVEIINGGALYNTIVEKSGSGNLSGAGFSVSTNTLSPAPTGDVFFSSSAITASVLESQGNFFLYMTDASVSGEPISVYQGSGGVRIYDSSTGQMSTYVLAENTLFPLQQFDLIRFGDSNPSNFIEGLDNTFDNGFLYFMTNIQGASLLFPDFSGSFNPIPQAHSLDKTDTNQTFRIIRKTPNESFVLIKNKPQYTDPGFLIPGDFNPNYDPYELAKKAGIIT
jgi:hypothetical protein